MRSGYDVVVVGRGGEGVDELKEVGEGYGRKVEWVRCDLSKDHEIKSLNLKPITLLIHNAASTSASPLTSTDYETEIGLNIKTVVGLTKRFLDVQMSSDKVGKGRRGIIFISSITGKGDGIRNGLVYGASKSFMNSFARGLRREIKGKKYEKLWSGKTPFTITTVIPGAVDTGFKENIRNGWCWKVPGYVLKPRRVAEEGVRGWGEGRGEVVVGGWNKGFLGVGGGLGEGGKWVADRMWGGERRGRWEGM
ncbi:hypothetical protein TL16_g00492 [Triparma laevis f. inornata]|uniref:NAD(P)-binding protein n=1 Tax=Triparma laevis f. inornata TaxID=1714386 RepID=A0A9W7DMR9_9STRA|nr:hypothetical protein TL16_g00492 [Triparma laevis f. inornata]